MDVPCYIVVRDDDLAQLEATVNERIDEGYSIAGAPFAVAPAQGGVLFVQPMVMEFGDEDLPEGQDELAGRALRASAGARRRTRQTWATDPGTGAQRGTSSS